MKSTSFITTSVKLACLSKPKKTNADCGNTKKTEHNVAFANKTIDQCFSNIVSNLYSYTSKQVKAELY
jgi:hypothetical protein